MYLLPLKVSGHESVTSIMISWYVMMGCPLCGWLALFLDFMNHWSEVGQSNALEFIIKKMDHTDRFKKFQSSFFICQIFFINQSNLGEYTWQLGFGKDAASTFAP